MKKVVRRRRIILRSMTWILIPIRSLPNGIHRSFCWRLRASNSTPNNWDALRKIMNAIRSFYQKYIHILVKAIWFCIFRLARTSGPWLGRQRPKDVNGCGIVVPRVVVHLPRQGRSYHQHVEYWYSESITCVGYISMSWFLLCVPTKTTPNLTTPLISSG